MNTSILTADQVAKALVNAPAPTSYQQEALENQTYRSELPADSYRSALMPDGTIERFGFDVAADGTLTRRPALYRMDGNHKDAAGNDVPHKAGDPIIGRDGNPANEATGMFVEATSGAKVRIYDSVLRKLSVSANDADRQLWNALTGNNVHSPIFTGATIVAVKQEVTDVARGYKQPRLIEA